MCPKLPRKVRRWQSHIATVYYICRPPPSQMTFRALALRQSESMDCGLCMAHTDQTHHRNSGATVLCSDSCFHVLCSYQKRCFTMWFTILTQNPSPVLRTSAFHISTVDQISDFSRTCEDLSVFYFAGWKIRESMKMCGGFKTERGVVLDGFLEHWIFPS